MNKFVFAVILLAALVLGILPGSALACNYGAAAVSYCQPQVAAVQQVYTMAVPVVQTVQVQSYVVPQVQTLEVAHYGGVAAVGGYGGAVVAGGGYGGGFVASGRRGFVAVNGGGYGGNVAVVNPLGMGGVVASGRRGFVAANVGGGGGVVNNGKIKIKVKQR